jgi:hypothetical protein
MPVSLPEPIALYVSSENARDTDALATCFAPNATVRDEGAVRKGLAEITAWRRETAGKYGHVLEPLSIAERDGKTIMAAKVSGNFPGSPLTLHFAFRLAGGKIASLEIGA